MESELVLSLLFVRYVMINFPFRFSEYFLKMRAQFFSSKQRMNIDALNFLRTAIIFALLNRMLKTWGCTESELVLSLLFSRYVMINFRFRFPPSGIFIKIHARHFYFFLSLKQRISKLIYQSISVSGFHILEYNIIFYYNSRAIFLVKTMHELIMINFRFHFCNILSNLHAIFLVKTTHR